MENMDLAVYKSVRSLSHCNKSVLEFTWNRPETGFGSRLVKTHLVAIQSDQHRICESTLS